MSENNKILILGGAIIEKKKNFISFLKRSFRCIDFDKSFLYPEVNYIEKRVDIEGISYIFTSTPALVFSEEKSNKLDEKIKDSVKFLINDKGKCDAIIWLVDSFEINDNIKLNKIFNKLDKSIIILSFLDNDKEKELNFFSKLKHNFFLNFSFNNKKFDYSYSFLNILKQVFDKNGVDLLKRVKIDGTLIKKEEFYNISIFGPPNSGKSTLMNLLLKEKRSIVHDVSGTTKESINSFFILSNFGRINLIDTPGIEKKEKIDFSILKNSDVLFLVLDITKDIRRKMINLIRIFSISSRTSIILLNKVDLVDNFKKKELIFELKNHLKTMSHIPIFFISALKNFGLNNVFFALEEMLFESKKKFSKKSLNDLMKLLNQKSPIRELKIYFIKHSGGWTHKFIFFINKKKIINSSYKRFILNSIRKETKLSKTSILLIFKESR